MEGPERLSLRRLALQSFGSDDVVVDIDWSGISTGTERLLWTGRMPSFPGMGYPLVPGYESVGRVVDAGFNEKARIGELVFVPGASCFKDARGLFGGAARRLIVNLRIRHSDFWEKLSHSRQAMLLFRVRRIIRLPEDELSAGCVVAKV